MADLDPATRRPAGSRSVWRTRDSQPPLIWRSAIPARLVHVGPHRKENQRFVQGGSSTHEASPPS